MTTSDGFVRSTVSSTVISFVMLAIGTRALGVARGQHLAGRAVLDDERAARHLRRSCEHGSREHEGRGGEEKALQAGGSLLAVDHLTRTRWPTVRFVGSIPGLSASSCSTVVSYLIATSLSVSPERRR